MVNYDKYTKAELIEQLQEKDTSIETLKRSVDIQDSPGNLELTPLNADSLLSAVLALPKAEKEVLPSLIRTTQKGMIAYTTIIYGNKGNDVDNDEVFIDEDGIPSVSPTPPTPPTPPFIG